jgi:hypothetical protein
MMIRMTVFDRLRIYVGRLLSSRRNATNRVLLRAVDQMLK